MATNSDSSILSMEELSNTVVPIIKQAQQRLAPNHIKEGIDVRVVENKKGQLSVISSVDTNIPKYADARAQEYGSGIHATRKFKSASQRKRGGSGKAGYIRIEPKKEGGVLAFGWQKADKLTLMKNAAKRRNIAAERLLGRQEIAEDESIKRDRDYLSGSGLPYSTVGKLNERIIERLNFLRKQKKMLGADVLRTDGNKFAGMSSYLDKDGNQKLMFNYVDHPGIKPANNGRGYLGAGLEDVKSEVLDAVAQASVNGLKKTIRRIFKPK